MCHANCLLKNIPRDWDCNSKGCLLDQKWDNIGVEEKYTSLYTSAKSKCSPAHCEKHKPMAKKSRRKS